MSAVTSLEISKNRHFCLEEVKAKREGKGPWGSLPAEIRKSSAIISAPGAPRDLDHPSENKFARFREFLSILVSRNVPWHRLVLACFQAKWRVLKCEVAGI